MGQGQWHQVLGQKLAQAALDAKKADVARRKPKLAEQFDQKMGRTLCKVETQHFVLVSLTVGLSVVGVVTWATHPARLGPTVATRSPHAARSSGARHNTVQ